MANFVETATLRLNDRTTANARKITAALKTLNKEAAKLNRLAARPIKLIVQTNSVAQAVRNMTALGLGLKKHATQKLSIKTDNRNLEKTKKLLLEINRQIGIINSKTVRANMSASVPRPGARAPQIYGPRQPADMHATNRHGQLSIDIHPLKLWSYGFIYRLGRRIEESFITGFSRGTDQVFTANTKQQQLGYDTATRNRFRSESYAQARAHAGIISPQAVRDNYAEISTILGPDHPGTRRLVAYAQNLKIALMNMGKTAEEAEKGMLSTFRGFDNMNVIQDAVGNLSPRFKDYFDTLIRSLVVIGADISPELFNTLTKFSRTTGKTLSPAGLENLLFLSSGMGRHAGSSLNRYVEQLTGHTTKAAMQAQEELGLVTLKEVDNGGKGKKRKKKLVYESTVEAEMLRENPGFWTSEILIPKLLKKLGIDENDRQAVGEFLNKPARIAEAVDGMFGSVVARDVALNMISTYSGEYKKHHEAVERVSPADARQQIAMNNPVTLLRGTALQLTNLAGEVGASILNNLVTPLQALNRALLDTANWAGNPEGNSTRRSTALLAGAGAVGIGGLAAFQKFTGFSDLKRASVNLDRAASNLNKAVGMSSAGGAILAGEGGGKSRHSTYLFGKGAAMAGVAGAQVGLDMLETSTAPEWAKTAGSVIGDTAAAAMAGSLAGPLGAAILGGLTFAWKSWQTGIPQKLWAESDKKKEERARTYEDARFANRRADAERTSFMSRALIGLDSPPHGKVRYMAPWKLKGMPGADRVPSSLNVDMREIELLYLDGKRAIEEGGAGVADRIGAQMESGGQSVAGQVRASIEEGGATMAGQISNAMLSVAPAFADIMSSNFHPAPVPVEVPHEPVNRGTNINYNR